MNATSTTRRADWLVPVPLIGLGVVPAIAATARLAELANGAEITPENARFFAQPFPVVLHLLAVLPYSLIGAFQFSRGFRRRNRGWHRAAGKVLAALGFVAALTGLWMAHFYPWPPSDGEVLYATRLVVGVAMVVCLVIAVHAALKLRNFKTHGEWMIRAYALGMGAGTQVFTHLPWFIMVGGMPPEGPRAVLMSAGWVINAVVAEWIIRRGRTVRSRTLAPAAAV